MTEIVVWDNLLTAYFKACRGKWNNEEAFFYGRNLDVNLRLLQSQLQAGTPDVGHYHYFRIYDPKERLICATSFRERVLHHAIMNVCHKYFDRTLIYDTYATRIEKGTYAALYRVWQGAKRYKYAVKLDVRKYFDSVSHEILRRILSRLFKDATLLRIFDALIDSYNTTDGYGIPIGNLTSQYFANLYLSPVDHFAKNVMRVPMYVRYMDDIVVLGNNKNELQSFVVRLEEYIQALKLKLKPKLYIRTEQGIPFLGYRVYPFKMLLKGTSKCRFKRKITALETAMYDGTITEEDYYCHVVPLIEYTKKAYTKQLRIRLCIEGRTACCVAAVGTTTRQTVA